MNGSGLMLDVVFNGAEAGVKRGPLQELLLGRPVDLSAVPVDLGDLGHRDQNRFGFLRTLPALDGHDDCVVVRGVALDVDSIGLAVPAQGGW